MMAERELPPLYSLADEQHSDSTPQPSSLLRPSAPPSLRLSPDPGLHPGPGSNSNVSLRSRSSVSDRSSSVLPQSYLDSTTFSIGTKIIKKPLITIEQIKSHSRLLRAFKLSQEKVEDPYSDPGVADVVPPVGRWLRFLEMAVERSVYFSVPGGLALCFIFIH